MLMLYTGSASSSTSGHGAAGLRTTLAAAVMAGYDRAVRAEGWFRDPYHLHDDRWFSDGRPTNLVRDDGATSSDEPPPTDPPDSLERVPEPPTGTADDLMRAEDAASQNLNFFPGR
jgi:hypothetical protein